MLDPELSRRPGGEAADPRRNRPLGGVEARQEDASRAAHRVGDDGPLGQLEPDGALDERLGNLEQLRGGREQLGLGEPAVAIVHRDGQRVADPGPRPHHRGLLDPQRAGDLVRRQEPDAVDVGGEPIRVLGDDRDGLGAVRPEDADRARGAHPVRVEEDHDLADRLLVPPGGHDPLRAQQVGNHPAVRLG